MISLTGILSLLSALAATSGALSCTQCMSSTSFSCSGDSVTCPSDHQCGSSYIDIDLGGMKVEGILRGCTPTSQCDIKGSVSFKQGRITLAFSCCDTDVCSPTIPALTEASSDPNGLVCPSCFSVNSTRCDPSNTLVCTGDENICLHQTTQVTTGPASTLVTIRGCATKAVCDLGDFIKYFNGAGFKQENVCNSDGIQTGQIPPFRKSQEL